MSTSILTSRRAHLVLGAFFALAAATVGTPATARAQAPTLAANDPQAVAQLRQWDGKLRGMRVTQLSRYNGGSSGGSFSRRDAYLCRDGRLFVERESSVAIYVDGASGGSSGTQRYSGSWRIIWQGRWPAVEMIIEGERVLLNIGWDNNGHTYFNGNRVYVTDEAAARCQ